ncbi:MAG: metallophosphoesterase [Cytophagales bacterium]|nr:metallophosphoesterase [Cytophagales bacterium]
MRLAIISDIHEDLISLQAALKAIDKLKCDKIVCLGDISGYSVPYYDYLQTRNAHECLRLVRENCEIVILGNHDIHAASIIPKHCSFFNFPNYWYKLDYHQRHSLANDSLWLHEENDLDPLYKESDIEYLKSLPEFSTLKENETNILFTHYAYPNLSGLKREFFTYTDEYTQHFKYMDSLDCHISFIGHAHVKGFTLATPKKLRQFRYKEIQIKTSPCCIGIPPITSLNKRNGFCIFDLDTMKISVVKL